MTDVVMTFIVVMVFAMIVAVLSKTYPRGMRRWPWIAFAVYLVSATAELIFTRIVIEGGDTRVYGATGAELAKVLDANFSWGASELTSMFFQQPSAFDTLVYGGGGGNTGSMHALAGILVYIFRGSEIAAHVCVALLAMCGVLGIYGAFRDSYSELPQPRLFAATALIPSLAYWTSALHKESLCVVGMGALFSGCSALNKGKWVRAFVLIPPGVVLIFLFRAPALLPLTLGLTVFFVLDRIQRLGGPQATAILTPLYFGIALVGFALAMVALTRLTPALSLDQVTETVSSKQQAWRGAGGASTYGLDDEAPQTLAGQIFRLPLALLNALFRPQLFDVHNFTALLSALEMTAATCLAVRALWRHGLGGLVTRIQRSPFLAMCLITTFVGCALVGIVTRNFGSLVRYRAPFLPFYGALLVALNHAPVHAKEVVAKVKTVHRRVAKNALAAALTRKASKL